LLIIDDSSSPVSPFAPLARRSRRAKAAVQILKTTTITTMSDTRTRIMKTTLRSSLFLGAVLGATLALSALAQETKSASPPLSAERTILVTVTAKVEAIDQPKRE